MTPATPRGGDPARYDGIQVLRAAAALLVLLCHARKLVPADWAWLWPWPHTGGASGGAIGVDLFFVVSGFVVAMSADRPGVTARGFLLDRATRVLPLYFAASLPWLALGAAAGALTWRQAWNTLAFLPAFDTGAYTNPAHWFGWSVGAELWFYLVFAAVVRWAPAPGARAAGLAAAAAAMVAAGSLQAGDWTLPRFAGMPMFLEFAAGALLYRHRRALDRAGAAALAPAGALLACCAAAALPCLAPHIGDHERFLVDTDLAFLRTVAWGVPAFALVAGVVALDRRRGGFRWPRALVRVGDWSYSVYLAQPFAIAALRPFAWPHWALAWAALLALVLVLAWAGHRWIERPATRKLRALLDGGRGAAPPRAAGPAPAAAV